MSGVKVLFFARIREMLNTDSQIVESVPDNVSQLREQLCSQGEKWRACLTPDRALVAVNQSLCEDSKALKEGDEVAFFPPVTGG